MPGQQVYGSSFKPRRLWGSSGVDLAVPRILADAEAKPLSGIFKATPVNQVKEHLSFLKPDPETRTLNLHPSQVHRADSVLLVLVAFFIGLLRTVQGTKV